MLFLFESPFQSDERNFYLIVTWFSRCELLQPQTGNQQDSDSRVVYPFFTGKQKLVDSAGRVERFMKKYGDTAVATGKKPAKTRKKAEVPAAKPRAKKAKAAEEKK